MTAESSASSSGYLFPSGHLGHLSTEQKRVFSEFKQLCVDRKLVTLALSDGTPPSHGDVTILRYLRARSFQLEPAFDQFRKTEAWRKENELEVLYETIDVTEYEEARRLYPQWTGRRDKTGMPIYLFDVAPLNLKAISATEKALTGITINKHTASSKMLRLFALYENLFRFVTPLCTAIPDRPYPETPLTQGNQIVDITGVGLKQFWDLKTHLQELGELATAYYPETLDKIIVIGAPSFFPIIWRWIQGWFDPVVVSKIVICPSANVLTTLNQYVDIKNIPKKYGGQLEWVFGDLPAIDPDIAKHLRLPNGKTRPQLPIGPIRWEVGSGGEMICVAVGSVDGVGRKEVLWSVDRKFEEVFFQPAEK